MELLVKDLGTSVLTLPRLPPLSELELLMEDLALGASVLSLQTRMHSSSLRVGCIPPTHWAHLVVSIGGACMPGGMHVQGAYMLGVCACWGHACQGVCMLVVCVPHTSPIPWTDRHLWKHNLCKLRLSAVKILPLPFSREDSTVDWSVETNRCKNPCGYHPVSLRKGLWCKGLAEWRKKGKNKHFAPKCSPDLRFCFPLDLSTSIYFHTLQELKLLMENLERIFGLQIWSPLFYPPPPPRIETFHGRTLTMQRLCCIPECTVSFLFLFCFVFFCFCFVKTLTLSIFWENADLSTFDFHCQFTLYLTIILSKPPSQYITTETCTGTLNSDYCLMSKPRLFGHLAFLHLKDWSPFCIFSFNSAEGTGLFRKGVFQNVMIYLTQDIANSMSLNTKCSNLLKILSKLHVLSNK